MLGVGALDCTKGRWRFPAGDGLQPSRGMEVGLHLVSVNDALMSLWGEKGRRKSLDTQGLAPFTGQTWRRDPQKGADPWGVGTGRQEEETWFVSLRAGLSQLALS